MTLAIRKQGMLEAIQQLIRATAKYTLQFLHLQTKLASPRLPLISFVSCSGM
jgi:hypothetical protein